MFIWTSDYCFKPNLKNCEPILNLSVTLKRLHTDTDRDRRLGLPPDMPPTGVIDHPMDIKPVWKEV